MRQFLLLPRAAQAVTGVPLERALATQEAEKRAHGGEPASAGRTRVPLLAGPGDVAAYQARVNLRRGDGVFRAQLIAEEVEGLGEVFAVRLDRMGGRIPLQAEVAQVIGEGVFHSTRLQAGFGGRLVGGGLA